jgi:hypothetical protein
MANSNTQVLRFAQDDSVDLCRGLTGHDTSHALSKHLFKSGYDACRKFLRLTLETQVVTSAFHFH